MTNQLARIEFQLADNSWSKGPALPYDVVKSYVQHDLKNGINSRTAIIEDPTKEHYTHAVKYLKLVNKGCKTIQSADNKLISQLDIVKKYPNMTDYTDSLSNMVKYNDLLINRYNSF